MLVTSFWGDTSEVPQLINVILIMNVRDLLARRFSSEKPS